MTIGINATTVLDVELDPIPSAPELVTQCRMKVEFLTQTEYYNVIEWTASTSPNVVSYKIYRDGKFCTEVSSSVHIFKDHNLRKNNHYTYQVSAVNALRLEGPLQEAIPGIHCQCR